jgi:hypothetical protein
MKTTEAVESTAGAGEGEQPSPPIQLTGILVVRPALTSPSRLPTNKLTRGIVD